MKMQNSQCDLESVVDEREHLAPFSLGGCDVSMSAECLRSTLTRLECQLGLMGVIESSSSGGTQPSWLNLFWTPTTRCFADTHHFDRLFLYTSSCFSSILSLDPCSPVAVETVCCYRLQEGTPTEPPTASAFRQYSPRG